MSTLVFFHAHPDDEAIATGGSMSLAASAGHRVVLVFGTRGEQGEPVEGVLTPGEPLGDRRAEESVASGEILGAARVEFLGYVDSGMIGEPTNDNPDCFWQADVEAASERFAEILRDESADLLTIYDDHGGYGHPDHIQVHRVGRRAAELAGVGKVVQSTMNRDAIRRVMAAAQDQGLEDEELDARTEMMEDEENPFGSPEELITHAIDVSLVISKKRAAMAAHASQITEESFFFAMPEESFADAFGTEWYIDLHTARSEGETFRTSLL
jgi:LmbE family N-acetylglucosaminyl deacetylase